jgi:hypothetical protein
MGPSNIGKESIMYLDLSTCLMGPSNIGKESIMYLDLSNLCLKHAKFEANLKEKFDSVMARTRLRKSRDSLPYLYFLQEKINSPTILQVN